MKSQHGHDVRTIRSPNLVTELFQTVLDLLDTLHVKVRIVAEATPVLSNGRASRDD